MKPTLALVIPCYNEEACLLESAQQLNNKRSELIEAGLISEASSLLFVDDGSKDNSWKLLTELSQKYPCIKALKLSKNFGHQNALWAGLMQVKSYSDCAISVDADLQDDLSVLNAFIEQFKEGCDIVYGVRTNRDTDNWFKKNSAEFFYRFLRALGVDVIYNHADYRLASKRVLEHLSHFNERNLFLRGIFPLIGFKSTTVSYTRKKRLAGKSKYPFRKMLSFSWSGITAFSVLPLRLISLLGFLVFLVSLIMSAYVFYEGIIAQHVVPGWSSILVSVYLLGGIQLLSLGIIGEYLGKNYIESKARPRYIIETELN